jgi:hypothetical protein
MFGTARQLRAEVFNVLMRMQATPLGMQGIGLPKLPHGPEHRFFIA